MYRLFIILFILIVIEIYAFQAFRTAFRSKWIAIGVEIVSVAMIAYAVFAIMNFDRSVGQSRMSLVAAAFILILLIPKFFISLILLLEDVIRILTAGYQSVTRQGIMPAPLPGRRKFISTIALGIAAVPFFGLLHGIFIGRYNFRVIRKQLFFDDLPEAFDGFTITQFSDLHLGSWDNADKMRYAVDLINETNSDLVLFTGDIVNAKATEMKPWLSVLQNLKQPQYGMFSVLGNHDYGEYLHWDRPEDKAENFSAIKNLHNQIGFRLLLNEHHFIKRGNSRITVMGVENWGHNFKKAGDLNKAIRGVDVSDFKILMTHDPSHWEMEVKNDSRHIHLTLSGHTHGMQFGIEIPGWLKWSPVQYVYKQWAGLYEEAGKYIYVNRGLGYHAYPGRVGIWPEITVLELKKRVNTA